MSGKTKAPPPFAVGEVLKKPVALKHLNLRWVLL
jgi:hypothetical protein